MCRAEWRRVSPEQQRYDFIRLLRQALGPKFPIVGVGGILSGHDAIEKIRAGADVVQLYSGLIYKGPALVTEVASALQQMRPMGQAGAAHRFLIGDQPARGLGEQDGGDGGCENHDASGAKAPDGRNDGALAASWEASFRAQPRSRVFMKAILGKRSPT